MEAETAPVQSTEDIAATVVAESESQDAAETSATESSSTEPAQAEAPPTPQELSDAAKFIVSKGHKWGKRENSNADLTYLPATTVERMMSQYLDQHRGTWDGRHSALETEHKTFKEHVEQNIAPILKALDGDPKAFLEMVAKQDPRYQSFLTPQEIKQQQQSADDPEPKLVTDQGQEAYIKSLNETRAWDRRQAKREAVAEAEAMFRPFKQEREASAAEQKTREIARTQMADAESWDGFGKIPADGPLTPFQQRVLGILEKDTTRRVSLRQAYLEVKAKALTAATTDEASIRARILEEMKTAPKSTSVTRTGPETTRAQGPRSTEDITRETIAKLGA